MSRTLSVLIVVVSLCISSVVIINNNSKVEATLGEEDEGGVGLDYQFVYNVTKNLSWVIFDAYNETDLPKGRAFGSKGEHYAKDLIYDYMNDIGLYNVTLEQIEDIPSIFDHYIPSINLTNKLETQSIKITIHNETNTTLNDFHIQPTWNWRLWLAPFIKNKSSSFKKQSFYSF